MPRNLAVSARDKAKLRSHLILAWIVTIKVKHRSQFAGSYADVSTPE
jgi:hypothetical protein